MGMRKLFELTKRFRREEDGAAMIEYTVLLGIITVAVIATIILVGTWVGTQWTTLEAALPS
jgi:pilus assembly protein Flp/PilA